MLLEYFASCTGCLPRWERRAANNKGKESAASVHVLVPAEVAPGSAQVPAADDANDPELPFQRELGVYTFLGEYRTIQATVNHSVSVNVVRRKLLKELGFETPRHDLPPELSKFAAEELPAHCGWEQLNICAPGGPKGESHEIQFVVVEDDDYDCDLLLGRASKGISFKPGDVIYTNFITPPQSKEEREKQQKDRKEDQAREAAAAAERKRRSAERLRQLRKGDPKSGDGAGEGTSA